MATLDKISQVITSSLDLDETLAIIVDQTHRLLDVEATSVILHDRDSGNMWFAAASGQVADIIQDKWLSREQGIADWVIRQGKPLVVPDVSKDSRFSGEWDKHTGFATRSILCVPLKAKGRTIGAIEAINKASGDFDREDLMMLTSMAASAAIAIENARLYEQAQKEIAERKRVEARLRKANRELRAMGERHEKAEEEIRRLYKELQDYANRLETMVAERTHELQAERDRTQAILEAVGEAVVVTNLEGTILYMNPAAVELTGYALEEAVGQSPSIWQAGRQSTATYLQEVERTFETQHTQVASRRRDGTMYDAATTVAPLFDSQEPGKLIGHVCVQRDITPLKEAERLKDEFVSNVSHELRTPLSVISLVSGNLDRLYERLPDKRRHKMIRDIREHAQLLNELVGDVLEISRIESGQVSMDRIEIDLAILASEEVEKQLPLAQRKSQSMHFSSDDRLIVMANSEQLCQVIRNLLNNAIKYTPDRGKITCDCAQIKSDSTSEAVWPGSTSLPPGRWAGLRVADTGVGIGHEDLPNVYDRFYRVRAQGNIPGTGLGLSIVKELIESHGGRIAAASTLGKGSIFAIYLPLLEE
jgi:PAS domain S-box-containing protein